VIWPKIIISSCLNSSNVSRWPLSKCEGVGGSGAFADDDTYVGGLSFIIASTSVMIV
jgi:hypothetical protein